ncbi:accessory gene regulator ArgB-like protein [Clostridium sp. ZS2-4]|uniref:accessory gene regulator ArgB-like protein n=1 Tax=Clostridium sp. ZS2-4 TaxID=2987703 RepID=UPI00227C7ECA|nr:accessory gene regulator B family protein [Clostridium sp. ZS2-4]MCY6354453.1 accessory gene regulator B family protein [Clostridium sp. ZS2-4]
MIIKLTNKVTNFIKQNSNIKNTDDLEKINYALQAILNEVFKIIIIITLFFFIGTLNYLLFSMVILFSIRIFSGGLHANTSLKCLIWSTLFFTITSVIGPLLPELNSLFYYILGLLNILIITVKSPYPNAKRSAKNKKRRCILKIIAIFSTIVWTIIILFYLNDKYYLNCGIITISLISIQLLYNKNNEEINNEKIQTL